MTGPWWQGAVFYEVYVRSFADSNDDGIGDLPGITARLDYLKRLGVDAVWLTPFYPSPQTDHGPTTGAPRSAARRGRATTAAASGTCIFSRLSNPISTGGTRRFPPSSNAFSSSGSTAEPTAIE